MPERSKRRFRSDARRACVLALLLAPVSFPAFGERLSLAAAQEAQSARAEEELLLSADVNREDFAEPAPVVRLANGQFLVEDTTLRKWRMIVPPVAPIVRGMSRLYPLDAIAGIVVRYDAAAQHLSIIAPAIAFDPSVVRSVGFRYPTPTPPPWGGFVNYAAVGQRGGGFTDYGAQLEAGAFSSHGVLVAGVLAQSNDTRKGVTRLDTTYTRDFPARLESLRVGDTTTQAGAWGRAVRVGGVQWGTDFGLQPGYSPYPTITAGGQAALPSTVDIFINNALVAQRPVPPGPFSITNIPTVSGAGTTQVVVRDLLGRETVVTQTFYGATDLLQPGLSQYSIAAGWERDNFGSASNDYGRPVATGLWRHGFTSTLTGEVRGEALREQGAAGASVSALFPSVGVLSGTLAGSHARGAGTGALVGVAFNRQTNDASVSVSAQWTTDAFRLSGTGNGSEIPELQAAATVGYAFGRYGSLNVGYVNQRFHQRPATGQPDPVPAVGPSTVSRNSQFGTIAYTLALPLGAAINLVALRSFGSERETIVTATLTIPWGAAQSASLSQTSRRGASNGNSDFTQVTVQRNLPTGEGWGYRVVGQTPGDYQASIAAQNNYAGYSLEGARFQGQDSVRASLSGSLGFIAGRVFAARELTDSFALVRVDDFPGVGVLLDNQRAGRTDSDGYAVLPRLRAYDINRVSIDLQDLPLDAEMGSLSVDAVPYYRSGILVDFPVRRARGATFRLMLETGEPMPAGAIVRIVGSEMPFPVGLGGAAYVAGLGRENRLSASWSGASCEFDLPLMATPDPLPDLGTVVCRGVRK